MPQLEVDKEEVKEGKGLHILTPNRLLAQIKAGTSSYELKKQNQTSSVSILSTQ